MGLKGLDNVKAAIADIDKPINDKLRGFYLQALGNIAGGAPIDEGRTRSNFFLKVGTQSTETTDDTSGNPHLEPMPDWVLGKKIFYVNNLPNIVTLEYGGYPGVGPKTAVGPGGIYSDQAVGGWVRKELLVLRAAIRTIS